MITVSSKPKTFAGAKYTPEDSYYDSDIQEQVDVYVIIGNPICAGSGSLCEFLDNNAKLHDSYEFGIKYSWGVSKEEMHFMFVCQDKAHSEGAAPPVHRMVKIINHRQRVDGPETFVDGPETFVYWGYTTSVAECKHNLVYGDYLQSEYEEYCYDYEDEEKRYRDKILSAIGEGDANYFPESLVEDLTGLIEEHFLTVGPLGIEEWAANKGYVIVPDRDMDELLNCLSNVLITKDSGQEYCLGGDLHSGNLAMWQGNIVCIDFSHHALMEV